MMLMSTWQPPLLSGGAHRSTQLEYCKKNPAQYFAVCLIFNLLNILLYYFVLLNILLFIFIFCPAQYFAVFFLSCSIFHCLYLFLSCSIFCWFSFILIQLNILLNVFYLFPSASFIHGFLGWPGRSVTCLM